MSRGPHAEPERVRAAAEELRRRTVDDPAVLAAALGEPVPVRGPAGELDSWFVPLTAGDRLLGFLQLEPDLRLHRSSSFEPDAPAARDWLDPAAILERARSVAGEGAALGEPVLGYHGSRDRLAWRVPVHGGGVVYVAGDHAFEEG